MPSSRSWHCSSMASPRHLALVILLRPLRLRPPLHDLDSPPGLSHYSFRRCQHHCHPAAPEADHLQILHVIILLLTAAGGKVDLRLGTWPSSSISANALQERQLGPPQAQRGVDGAGSCVGVLQTSVWTYSTRTAQTYSVSRRPGRQGRTPRDEPLVMSRPPEATAGFSSSLKRW